MVLHFSRGIQPRIPVDHLYRTMLGAGWAGVDLFFVLSGFLITGILLDNKNGPRFYRNFYVRRALRIVPAYYGFLLVSLFIVVPLAEGRLAQSEMTSVTSNQLQALTSQQWVFWLYLNNFASVAWGYGWAPFWTAHLWSLAVEEQFYLVWPPIVRNLTMRSLAAVSVGAIIFSSCFRIWLDLHTDPGAQAAYFLTPARLDPLAVGALIAIAVRNARWRRLAQNAAWPAIVVATAAIGAAAFYRRGLAPGDPWVHMVVFPSLAVFFGAILTFSVTTPREHAINRILSARGLRTLGKYSYAMYIFHLAVHWVGLHLYARLGVPDVAGSAIPGSLVYVGVGILCTYALAWISWHAYEKRFMSFKRYFPVKRVEVAK